MITKIVLKDVVPFSEKTEISPSKVNYIYGFNGSGKTTIGNVLNNSKAYMNCKVEDTDNLDVLVYNKDFVDELFSNTSKLKGIFTLGKDADKARTKIEDNREKIKNLKLEDERFNENIKKKQEEKEIAKNKLQDPCWNIKLKYENDFKEAMRGVTSKKIDFMQKCLSISLNKNSIKSLETLKKEYNELFNSSLVKRDNIEEISYKDISEIESDNILQKEIKGNDTLTVSELINKLNNSDWVKEGMKFLDKSEEKCPFCQQKLPLNINELSEYFNKEYEDDCNKIENLLSNYESLSKFIINKLDEIQKIEYIENKLELSKLAVEIKSQFDANIVKLKDKYNNPSISLTLSKSFETIQSINVIIKSNNDSSKIFNTKIDNVNTSKENLIREVWNYFSNELDGDINVYKNNDENCNKAINPMNEKLSKNIDEIKKLELEIKVVEKDITGITATLDEINRILSLFGFNSFKLVEGSEIGTYKIIRNNGDDVGKSLSEGEYRFISFLYFYYLISGSNESSGLTRDKIIIIDDPISSLDSNSLFIVSTLTKNIIKECFNDLNGIKQVFVMTHNVYFYKEVIFRGNRENKKSIEKYFVVNKKNEISNIKEYEKNPINTTYELLWEELRQKEKNKSTIYNTMRRILEYYFNIIGGIDYEIAINKFEGNDKIICNSLISCINDTSHYISEDLNVIFDDDMLDRYLYVFKNIFNNMGHISHYNMMMKVEGENNGQINIEKVCY